MLTTEQRFWAKVRKTESYWLWTGKHNEWGYGKFQVSENKRVKYWSAHRYAYELLKGKEPGKLLVCHHCDTPPCVNPDHLFLGTVKDNTHDAMRKGRLDHRLLSAKLDESQVAQIKTLISEGRQSQETIGALYGVDQTTISRIKLEKRRIRLT